MKILWFTNVPMPAMYRKFGGGQQGGYWMAQMLAAARVRTDIEFAVVTIWAGNKDIHFEEDGVHYFLVSKLRCFKELFWRKHLKKCTKIVDEWKPDLIHIHGSENYYGMLKVLGLVGCPITVSIQGLKSVIATRYYGDLTWQQVFRMERISEFLRGSSPLWEYRRMCNDGEREVTIIKNIKYIMGRTIWSRSHVWAINPAADYFYVHTIMRPPFYQDVWDIGKVKRHSLFLTNAGSPFRGVETLIDAVALLIQEFPDIQLRVAGNIGNMGYGRFLRRYLNRSKAVDRIEFIGHVNGEQLSRELCATHVFVIPSFMEHTPNSLAEAQLVGMPCVASSVGGVPCMIEEGRTGLMFAPGDSAVLADRIKTLFEDDDLAVSLGSAARNVALDRHSPDKVIEQLKKAYEAVLAQQENEGN